MTIETTKTPENAREALRLIGEIVDREKCSRTALFKRLGITGYASADIANGSGCTPAMLERVRTEHTRVCGPKSGAGVKAATKAGILVRQRDEDAELEEEEQEIEEEDDSEEEPEDEEDDESEEDDEQADEDEEHEEIEEEERRVPSPRVPLPTVEDPPRFGPTVPGKGAPLVSASYPFVEAPAATGKTAAAARALAAHDGAEISAAQLPSILSSLARAVAVVEQLGGIDRAERIAAAIAEVQ